MSLSAAIEIGRTALAASQIGIQIAGNNMANAATPGYSRQIGRLVPTRGDNSLTGISIGGGVQVSSVQRQVDNALQSRLWSSGSDMAAAGTRSQIYSAVENTLGELGNKDLSSQISTFFQSWSERANQTQSSSAVVQEGDQLASFIKRVRGELSDQKTQIDQQLGAGVDRANQLLVQIAGYNSAISDSEVGGATANTLRDQRDNAINELSGLMDVTAIDHGSGGMDILVGSTPVVLGGQTRGLTLRRETNNGSTTVSLATVVDGSELNVQSGTVGSLLAQRTSAVDGTIQKLDSLTSTIIFEVNKLHSTGRNADGLTQTSGTVSLPSADRTLAMNDPNNHSFGDLPFHATNGGFMVNIRNKATGTTQSVRVNVDLDGITNAGTPGTADDTSAEDIRSQLAAIPGLSATFSADGKLNVSAQSGFDFSFSDDSSSALAVLGLNSYFTGTDGRDIAVRADLKADPTQLTTGREVNGVFVENGTAMGISGLQGQSLTSLGGNTITGLWRDAVQSVGGSAAAASTAADAAAAVHDSLDSQRAAISGVSVDEESLNLMDYQRQYQGAAKIISTVDQMTQILMQLV